MTESTHTATRTIENLTWIRDHWHTFTDLKHKGTPLPWHETHMDPTQRAHLDHLARLEKANRGAGAFGESPAPINLGPHDREQHIAAELHKHARRTAQTLNTTGAHVVLERTSNPDPTQLCTFLATHLTALADIDDRLTYRILRTSMWARKTIERMAGNVVDGQRLKTECPWCLRDNVRIRVLPHGEPVVTCESGICNPGQEHCSYYWRGNPIWHQEDWEWLAVHYDHHHTTVVATRGTKTFVHQPAA